VCAPGGGVGVATGFAGARAVCTLWAETYANLPNTNDGADLRIGTTDGGSQANSTTPWPVADNDNPHLPTLTCVIHGPRAVQLLIFPRGTGTAFYTEGNFTWSIIPN